jgi:hypothetical protein
MDERRGSREREVRAHSQRYDTALSFDDDGVGGGKEMFFYAPPCDVGVLEKPTIESPPLPRLPRCHDVTTSHHTFHPSAN